MRRTSDAADCTPSARAVDDADGREWCRRRTCFGNSGCLECFGCVWDFRLVGGGFVGGGEMKCGRSRAWRGRRDDAGLPASTNTVVLRLRNEPRRGVHDLEPRLIHVPAVAGHAPCGLCGGFATPNRLADKRLREGVCRQYRQHQDDRERRPICARHRPQHTPHPF